MNEEILEKYAEAGRIAAQALQHGAALIKPGAQVREVLDKVEAFILEKGAGIAFPAQVSRNEVAAHFCPTEDDETVFSPTDVVKLDVGVHVDGYVGDNALTINLDEEDEEKERLVEASRAARDAAIDLVKAGVTLHELGAAIEHEIRSRGFTPVRNLSGHGVAQYVIHTKPSIPNYANKDKTRLEAGQVVAIEPFASTGAGLVVNASEATLFSLGVEKGVRSAIARELLQRIKSYNGLPFTTRWLSRELGAGKTKLGLLQLRHAGILHEYPPLPDQAKGLVSQSEHTVLVEEDGCRILTKP